MNEHQRYHMHVILTPNVLKGDLGKSKLIMNQSCRWTATIEFLPETESRQENPRRCFFCSLCIPVLIS